MEGDEIIKQLTMIQADCWAGRKRSADNRIVELKSGLLGNEFTWCADCPHPYKCARIEGCSAKID